MDKAKYKREKKRFSDMIKEAKVLYKAERPKFKVRVKKFIKPEHYRISGFFHVRREYKELKKTFDYIMSSLKVINVSAKNEDQLRTEIGELISFVSE